MKTCHECNTKVAENEVIKTDYFQVYGEGAPVYELCPVCYLKSALRFIEEGHQKCDCGKKLVSTYKDDLEELVSMGQYDCLIVLSCPDYLAAQDSGNYNDEELEALEETHIHDFMLYTYSVDDDAMNFGTAPM